MARKARSGLLPFVVGLAVASFNGCTLVGLGIGSTADAFKPSQRNISAMDVEELKPGASIDVVQRNGYRIRGRYLGIEPVPAEEYAASYEESRAFHPPGLALPALGDSVTISLDAEEQLKGEFLGFDYGYISLAMLEPWEARRVGMGSVSKIVDSSGNVLRGQTIRRLMSERTIPFMSAIALEAELGKTLVPIDKVDRVEVPVRKRGKLIGALVGAVLDAVLVVALILDPPST